MSKVFEYILTHPIQSIIVLVIGVSITYTTIRILRGIFGLCTRKRKARKELEKQERQAELVLKKLGGVEAFSELVAEKVISKQKSYIDKFKQAIERIQTMDKCPIELKAYIETVLKTSPNLLLQYEENKSKLVEKQTTKIKSKEQVQKEEIATNATVVLEKTQENIKEEISYV